MIEESYVSFETAKLLKEKGFDVAVRTSIELIFLDRDDTEMIFHLDADNWNAYSSEHRFSCPTLQLACKWLREVHNMYYDIQLLLGEKAEKYGDLQLGIYQLSSSGAYVWKDWIYADTYVELYENYIKYCLENLI